MKKFLLTTLIVLAAITFLMAKGTSETPTGGTKKSEITELELFMSKPETADLMQKIADMFCEENPNVKISVSKVPSTGEGRTVTQTRLASDELPDIMNTFPCESFYKTMFEEGYIEDISDQDFLNKVSKSSLELTIAPDGKYYALPMSDSAYGIYANMDVLNAHGISETPKDWEEFLKDLATLKAAGVNGILMPDKDAGNVAQRFERSIGIINNNADIEFRKIADGDMKAEDSPSLKAWMKYNEEILKYANDDHMGMDYDVAVASFSKGEAGFMMSGPWMLSTIKGDNPNANVKLFWFPNPTGGETKVPINVDTSFSISSKCKDKTIALKFLEYMTRPEIAQMYCDTDGNISLIEGVKYNVPEHQDMVEAVDNGSVYLTMVNRWPSGLREELQPYCQQFLADLNETAFLKAAQEVIPAVYAESK